MHFNGVHILNGDALKEKFFRYEVSDEIICIREGLVEGPVIDSIGDDFWRLRSKHHNEPENNYETLVVREFNKIREVPDNIDINIWFENDLFCQVNFWFTLKFINESGKKNKLFRVFPVGDSKWATFGNHHRKELERSFEQRRRIGDADLQLGSRLWDAFATSSTNLLLEYAQSKSDIFQYLDEVVMAHVQRFPTHGEGRPEQVLRILLRHGVADFETLFREFSNMEPVYGFGDAQVRHLLQKLG